MSQCQPDPDTPPPDSAMKVSVVIPTRRRCGSLARTLDSMAAQAGRDFDVIVVCDGEDPETLDFSQSRRFEIPVTWIFVPQNRGLAAARNRGAAEAGGKLLLFLDDDATVNPDWIGLHRKYHQAASPGVPRVVMGGVVHVYAQPPGSPTERMLRQQRWQPDERYAEGVRSLAVESGQNLEGYCGFNCSIRKDVFFECGGFDDAMRPVDEEMELGHRLHRSGLETVVALDAVAYHHDTRNLVAYHESCQENSGVLDVYRIAVKGQRSIHLTALRSRQRSGPAKQFRTQLAWNHPDMIARTAGFWHALADLTDSAWCFRRWQELAMSAAYWKGVRSTGMNLEKLETLAGTRLPVLALHGIMPALNAHERRYHLTPHSFQRTIEALTRLGYRSSTLEEGLHGDGRQYLVTFDDGYENLYTELLPHIERYRLKPIVFLVADRLGGENQWDFPLGVPPRKILTVQQVREMQRHGVEFGSHTSTHPWLPRLNVKDVEREVTDSKHKLEDVLGVEVTTFAYPYGAANSAVRSAVARAGYRQAYSLCPGRSWLDDPFWIRRIEVREADPWLASLIMVTTGAPPWRKLNEYLRRVFQTGSRRLPEPVVAAIKRVKRQLDIPL